MAVPRHRRPVDLPQAERCVGGAFFANTNAAAIPIACQYSYIHRFDNGEMNARSREGDGAQTVFPGRC
jgi:hypothetical protein